MPRLGGVFYLWSPQREKINPHRCLRQVDSMGITTMPEHSGAWWSYPIYASGFAVAAMSPDQWLMTLSILAVLARLAIDVPTVIAKYRPKFDRLVQWVSKLWP